MTTLVAEKDQVFSRDSHEYVCCLEGDGSKLIDDCMNHSLVNQSSGFLDMRRVLYMGPSFHVSLFISISENFEYLAIFF